MPQTPQELAILFCAHQDLTHVGTLVDYVRSEVIRQGLRERGHRACSRYAQHRTWCGLGCWRWIVEPTFVWWNQFRGLRVRYEKRADIHEAFSVLACALLRCNALATHGGGQWVGAHLGLTDAGGGGD
jgi:hypothetical protein